jgi:hypothetical protein
MYAGLVAVCCFIAFWFLLLVSISVPTVKSIYLFYLTTVSSSIPLRINFGVWGYCIPAVQYHIVGVSRVTTAYCSPPHLGWTFDSKVANYLSVSRTLENAITTATTIALVLNPIATGLTFLTFVLSLLLLCAKQGTPQRIGSIVVLICCILAVTLTTIAFLVDIIVTSILRNKVSDATDGLVFVNYGNAIWLTLVATIALWFAIAGACCGVFRQRKPNTNTY